MLGNIWDQYDQWKCTDTEGQLAWDKEYELDWVESLVRQEFPHMEDECILELAEERMNSGYYATLDF